MSIIISVDSRVDLCNELLTTIPPPPLCQRVILLSLPARLCVVNPHTQEAIFYSSACVVFFFRLNKEQGSACASKTEGLKAERETIPNCGGVLTHRKFVQSGQELSCSPLARISNETDRWPTQNARPSGSQLITFQQLGSKTLREVIWFVLATSRCLYFATGLWCV